MDCELCACEPAAVLDVATVYGVRSLCAACLRRYGPRARDRPRHATEPTSINANGAALADRPALCDSPAASFAEEPTR
jgi:hypothetical protein